MSTPMSPELVPSMVPGRIHHRFIHADIDAGGALIEALTHDDCVQTCADGSWRSRSEFVAQGRHLATHTGAESEAPRVRQFGRMALVHGRATQQVSGGTLISLRYTDVYRWCSTAWRLVSVQDTRVTEGTPVGLITGTAPAFERWTGRDAAGDDADAVLHTLNEQYVRAFREADVAWYDAHLAPDYLVVNGDGSLHDRASALARFALPTFATSMRSFPVSQVTLRRFDDVALIHAENDYELKDGRRGASRYTDIWHQREGRWLCVAAHITVLRRPVGEGQLSAPGGGRPVVQRFNAR